MRLPFLQVSQEEMARARTLAGYLSVPYVQALGMTVALKAAALEAAPEYDVSGVILDPNPAEWMAVQCGWPLDRADALAVALVRCGFAMAGPQGGHSVASMEPYAKALDTSEKRSEAGRRGAEARKLKGGYGRAMAGPQQSDSQGMAHDAKTQTQTQTQTQKEETTSSAPPEASPLAATETLALALSNVPAPEEASGPLQNSLANGPGSPAIASNDAPSTQVATGLVLPLEKAAKTVRRKTTRDSSEVKTDPRHSPLISGLVETHREVKGAPYGFAGGKDAKAVTELLALADQDPCTAGDAAPAEVLRRWAIGLEWVGYPACTGLMAFRDNWNAYVRKQAGRAASFTRGSVRAEGMDHSRTGDLDF